MQKEGRSAKPPNHQMSVKGQGDLMVGFEDGQGQEAKKTKTNMNFQEK